MLNTIARWIVTSSTNPSKVSLTIKGVLVGAIPTLMMIAGLAQLNVGSDQLNAIIDGSMMVLQGGLTVISAVMTTYGLIRKLLNTIKVHEDVTSSSNTFQG